MLAGAPLDDDDVDPGQRQLPASISSVGPAPTITAARSGHTQFAPPISGRFWPRPAIVLHDRGLAASPRVRYRLKLRGAACWAR